MEHLFFAKGDDRHTFGLIKPTTEWLNFPDHESAAPTRFHTYPSERGWDLDQIWLGNLSAAHPSLSGLSAADISRSTAAMLQSWLYLGLLEAVLRRRVPVKNITKLENGGDTLKLDSLRLGIYFMTWNTQACIMLKDPAAQNAWNRSVVEDLIKAHTWVTRLSRFQRPAAGCPVTMRVQSRYIHFPGFICEAILAINRLAETIDCARRRIFAKCDGLYPGLTWKAPDVAADARTARMRSRGWCPFTISMLETTTCESVLDWIDAAGKVHPATGHGLCSPHGCVRNNVNTNDYVTLHIQQNCNCQFLIPQIKDVISALEAGRTPVIRVVADEGAAAGHPRIQVAQSAADTPYVAFSHVWADGLGSVTEKGIPTCQALRLAKLAEGALGPNTPLWIDSLCIPAEKEWRKRAIIALNRTYREAAAVIVIDQTIRKTPSSTSPEDFLLSVYTSGWCQRLWTYQESILAARIYFELADGVTEFKIPRSKISEGCRVVWEALGKEIYRLRVPNNGKSLNFGHIARALTWRCTSNPEDETIAIGAVLSVDVARLLKTTEERRKMMFFKLVRNLPYNIIFDTGEKLPVRPYTWAPKTLMSGSRGVRLCSDDAVQTSVCTAHGLVGNYLVVRLEEAVGGTQRGAAIWYAYNAETDVTYILRAPVAGWKGAVFDLVAVNTEFKRVPEIDRVTSAVALVDRKGKGAGKELRVGYVGSLYLDCVNGRPKDVTVGCVVKTMDLCIQ